MMVHFVKAIHTHAHVPVSVFALQMAALACDLTQTT